MKENRTEQSNWTFLKFLIIQVIAIVIVKLPAHDSCNWSSPPSDAPMIGCGLSKIRTIVTFCIYGWTSTLQWEEFGCLGEISLHCTAKFNLGIFKSMQTNVQEEIQNVKISVLVALSSRFNQHCMMQKMFHLIEGKCYFRKYPWPVLLNKVQSLTFTN